VVTKYTSRWLKLVPISAGRLICQHLPRSFVQFLQTRADKIEKSNGEEMKQKCRNDGGPT